MRDLLFFSSDVFDFGYEILVISFKIEDNFFGADDQLIFGHFQFFDFCLQLLAI